MKTTLDWVDASCSRYLFATELQKKRTISYCKRSNLLLHILQLKSELEYYGKLSW